MSCGNRFQCGLTKLSRNQFQPDKPSNPELHNENQKRLNELLKARGDIDKQFNNNNIQNISSILVKTIDTLSDDLTKTEDISNNFTAWKVPSTSDYKAKIK